MVEVDSDTFGIAGFEGASKALILFFRKALSVVKLFCRERITTSPLS
jgi:hypothetical protein